MREPHRKLKIEQVVSDIHRMDSGASYAVTRLAEALASEADVTLHTLEPRPERQIHIDTRFYERLGIMSSLGISRSMKRGLAGAARTADIIHSHGLWMMPNVYPARAVRGVECALVISPHGMLEPFALTLSARKKAVFSRLSQNRALNTVDCFHATSQMEAESIRSAGYTAPIAVIPIGIDIPPEPAPHERNTPRLLYLGRLHPKKNIEGLLRAWSNVRDRHPDWRLTIAGPGDRVYVERLHALAAEDPRVRFIGPVYGDAKAKLLASSDLFVLPTHSENFGIVVAEALSYGVPVLTTTGTPWSGLETHDCGWWVDIEDESLVAALDEALSRDGSSLRGMGSSGRAWMQREFGWSVVAEKTIAVYRWLSSADARPPTSILR